MLRNILIAASLILPLMLTGCFQTIHGGGTVDLLNVQINEEPGLTGSANVGVSFNCNDQTNRISGILTWKDKANGVKFTGRLPWLPISYVSQGQYYTCAEAEADANDIGAAINLAFIYTQGPQSGIAGIAVGKPGAFPEECGDASPVEVATAPTVPDAPSYQAAGCLDRGNFVFQ